MKIHISKDKIPAPRNPFVTSARKRKAGIMDGWKNEYNRKKQKIEEILDEKNGEKDKLLNELIEEIEQWMGDEIDKFLKQKDTKQKIKEYKILLEKEIKDDYYKSEDANIQTQIKYIKNLIDKISEIKL